MRKPQNHCAQKRNNMSLKIQEHVVLAPFTTFNIGGPARYLCEVRNEEDVKEGLEWGKSHGMKFVLLAGGSNVLIPDSGLDALVMHIVEGSHTFDDDVVTADFGCNLLALIRDAGTRSLGGWEKLSGIPGSIGGAVRGNAGAFGTEMKDIVTYVRALNTKTGKVKDFTNAECAFSYRHSFFKDNPQWVILRVQVRLAQGQQKSIATSIEATIAERERRHLQDVQAAGSFFMNPVAPKAIVDLFEKEKGVLSREGRVPAGWLIEKAGLKGAKVGGAVASEQHPNYIVNTGGASANDVLRLALRIKREVFDRFVVKLKEEAAVF